ncbi:HAMP domain-containing histidine kinase [Mucilaginibacter sp. UR6-1]|uniref:sensor histidine kinase n=1 Tax=Mucilaginibacter sp. UR6-1 TaxID=1435643 RepID=UPI001E57BF17|nr:HAMP domain-containing sensor histidine kinase [Mucilaginibacter sp. UR6-1]MCC8410839.1 HAMP domain-containing histidine kinase [Mucilaginibacter sp. UR6-1]
MVKAQRNLYRKNFSLIIIFMILITILLVIAFITAYNLTGKYVENEFASKKIDVLEQTISPYNDFFQNKIPEVTSYQGFLDSSSAATYASSVFTNYAFVRRVIFYDIRIGKRPARRNRLGIFVQSVYEFTPNWPTVNSVERYSPSNEADFRAMAGRLNEFINRADTLTVPSQNEVFRTFYDVKPDKISYLNVPRRQDIKMYKEMQKSSQQLFFKQNMMTFLLDPRYIRVKNPHRELYQKITVEPVVYDPLYIEQSKIITEVALPGAFSNYKLYFVSDRGHLTNEINRRFMPIGGIALLIYFFLLLTAWLIYRNLNVNLKLFKLQYDFINNFTHEFKTPVSVIKIAGSNLRGENPMSERQLKHYGRILDEEADKLNELMNRLLSFTQLENRSIATKKEGIDIESFIKRYIETFSIKYHDFQISLDIEEGVNYFQADPVMLGSVFQNLMENAYKYSHPQKKVLDIKIWREKKNIHFSFADQGIGVPKTELSNIFKKFYRLENQYNQNGSVGLGLAFCKELVNFMDGDILIKSKVNQGSEFIVILPYQT